MKSILGFTALTPEAPPSALTSGLPWERESRAPASKRGWSSRDWEMEKKWDQIVIMNNKRTTRSGRNSITKQLGLTTIISLSQWASLLIVLELLSEIVTRDNYEAVTFWWPISVMTIWPIRGQYSGHWPIRGQADILGEWWRVMKWIMTRGAEITAKTILIIRSLCSQSEACLANKRPGLHKSDTLMSDFKLLAITRSRLPDLHLSR